MSRCWTPTTLYYSSTPAALGGCCGEDPRKRERRPTVYQGTPVPGLRRRPGCCAKRQRREVLRLLVLRWGHGGEDDSKSLPSEKGGHHDLIATTVSNAEGVGQNKTRKGKNDLMDS